MRTETRSKGLTWVILSAVLVPLIHTAHAKEVRIPPEGQEGAVCINASAEAVHRYLNNYAHYKDIPDSTYKVGLFSMLKIVSSSGSYFEKAPFTTDSYAYARLAPFLIEDSTYHPKVHLECKTRPGAAENSFEQRCSLLADHSQLAAYFDRNPGLLGHGKVPPQPFGLESFESTVTVVENSSDCLSPHARTRLTYDVRLSGKPEDIKAIKIAMLGKAAARSLGSLIESVYGEEKCFVGFYSQFYPALIADLQSQYADGKLNE
jgi:hypothetical protein